MPTVVVALKDILTDETDPVDLTTLPVDEAIAKLRDIYGFFGPLLDITIDDGVATITLPEQQARQVDRALASLKDAARAGARGRYAQAIRIYQEVLDLLPTHSAARRELGMAYMEDGNARAAKEHLIRAIQLNPKDAWAYLILGNLYYQMENDPGSAERYFITAIDLAPDDPFILNSYAALLAKRGDTEQALALFQRAIDAGPGTPRPRYGLALLLAQGGDTDAAIAALEALFARPISPDVRDEPVYAEARRLYAELRRRRLADNQEQTLQRLRQTMDDYAAESGTDIRLEQDAAIATDAKVELAWRYGRPYHLIKYARQLTPLMLAHEFEHILLDSEARSAGCSRIFTVGQAQRAAAERSIERDLRKLRSRRGIDARSLDQFVAMLLQGLPNQLYNMPADCLINRRLYERYPWLGDAIFVGIETEQAVGARAVTDADIRSLTPPRIYQANVSMNAAYALFVDDLFGHGQSGRVTDYASAYTRAGVLPTAKRLYALYQASGDDPCAVYGLVDAWAEELKLTDWYLWRSDATQDASDSVDQRTSRTDIGHRDVQVSRARREGGATNLDYFADPGVQMAAAMYMVSALKRFAKMERQAILQVATEVAMIGADGIEYGDPDLTYTVSSLPGEEFTGLQMLCLEYVGFKLTEPELDTRIPLEEGYQQALKLYEMGM